MSAQIRAERKAYYDILETTQKVAWTSPAGYAGFCLDHAFGGAEVVLENVIAKPSQDAASRDINDLVARGIPRKDEAGGRSTSYSLGPITGPGYERIVLGLAMSNGSPPGHEGPSRGERPPTRQRDI